MTGWRIGFAVGRPELIGALTRVKSYTDTGPFLAVQKAGAAALDQAEALVEPIRAELERRRDAAVAGAAGGGLHARVAQGGDVSLGGAAGRHAFGGVRHAGARGDRHGGAARAARSVRRAKASSASRSRSAPTGCGRRPGGWARHSTPPAEESLRSTA